jgi:carbonyl reductase 1
MIDEVGCGGLYGLVNNAGTGLQHNVTKDTVIKTNYYGTKWMTEIFLPILNPDCGRVVNVGSGSGPMFV